MKEDDAFQLAKYVESNDQRNYESQNINSITTTISEISQQLMDCEQLFDLSTKQTPMSLENDFGNNNSLFKVPSHADADICLKDHRSDQNYNFENDFPQQEELDKLQIDILPGSSTTFCVPPT